MKRLYTYYDMYVCTYVDTIDYYKKKKKKTNI